MTARHELSGPAAGEDLPPRCAVGVGRWALESLVVEHLTVARVAAGLGVSWHTANDAVLAEGRRVLIEDPSRFDAVTTIGVDEHGWRHTRHGEKYVTVIIDLMTPIRANTGSARLLDVVVGRSKAVFTSWLTARPGAWRQKVEVAAMDGFIGFRTAAAEELPDAVPAIDPFHVVRLAGDALARCRHRVQTADDRAPRTLRRPALCGSPDPAHRCEPPHRQSARPPEDRFAADEHVEVEATWRIYHRMIAA